MDVHLEPGDLDEAVGVERMRDRHVAGGEGRVLGVVEQQAQSDPRIAVGAVEREPHAELFDDAAGVGGADLRRRAVEVLCDAGVAVDRSDRLGLGDRRGPTDVVEVGVDHRHDRIGGDRAEFAERRAHLLHRLTGVDRDDAPGSADEGLVGESVSDETPHVVGDLVQAPFESVPVLYEHLVGHPPPGVGAHARVVRSYPSGVPHPVDCRRTGGSASSARQDSASALIMLRRVAIPAGTPA